MARHSTEKVAEIVDRSRHNDAREFAAMALPQYVEADEVAAIKCQYRAIVTGGILELLLVRQTLTSPTDILTAFGIVAAGAERRGKLSE